MTTPKKHDPHLIPPEAYPQMMSRANAAVAMRTLRSAQTSVRAAVAMEASVPPMRAAILDYVDELERCAGDMGKVFDQIHEIRGFAETAGLASAGRIAEILCRYMDESERLGRPADPATVTLHISAVCRAARSERDDLKMTEIVVAELSALVSRKLKEPAKA